MAILLLIALLGLIAGSAWHGQRDYASFRTLSDTAARQRRFWWWTAWGLAVTAPAGLAALWALGREAAVFVFPTEFASVVPVGAALQLEGRDASFWVGAAVGGAIALVLPILIWRQRIASMRLLLLGDIEPMLPRNRAELLACIPLSLSAGLCEEILFRLALPLVVTLATGSALVGFVVATVAFGLSHVYQGWKGVLATGGLGAVLAWVYLSTGSLLRPIIVHVVVDLLALVVRPVLAGRISRPQRPTPTGALAHEA